MEEGLDDLRNYILENAEISSDAYMKLMDFCFQYCSRQQETELYRVVAESFMELCDRKKAKLARLQEVRDYCLTHPVYPDEKNINRKIVDFAFPLDTLTRQEMENFLKVSESARRICSYLHRFWIPNQQQTGSKITTSNGTQVPVTTFDRLALCICNGASFS